MTNDLEGDDNLWDQMEKREMCERRNNHDSITNVKEMSSWENCTMQLRFTVRCIRTLRSEIYHRNAKRLLATWLNNNSQSTHLRLWFISSYIAFDINLTFMVFTKTFSLKYVRIFSFSSLTLYEQNSCEIIYFGKRKSASYCQRVRVYGGDFFLLTIVVIWIDYQMKNCDLE